MGIYDRDEELQTIHDEMYAGRASETKKGISTLTDENRSMLGVGIAILFILVIFGKLDIQKAFLIGVAGLFALYLMAGTEGKRSELTWLECMIRLYDLLEFLQKHPIGKKRQIPKGEIKITPIGRKQWYEGRGFKRGFGVDIYDEIKDVTESYYVELDIINGDIITFRRAPDGVWGDETQDVKLIATPDMLMKKKAEQYFGRAWQKI